MNQTKLESLAETLINVAIGWVIGLATQFLIFPVFGIHVTFSDQLWLSVVFTVVSIIRSYAVRRWFNAGIHKLAINSVRQLRKKMSIQERT